MKRKTSFLSLFLLVFPILAAAQEPGYPQVDTLVIRRDSLDAARGVIRSIPDTIYFTYSADAIFTKKVSLEEEMTFKPLRITDTPILPMEHLADPVERLARARACRLAYRFEEALSAIQQAQRWADVSMTDEIEAEYSLILNAMSLSDNCQTPVAVMKKQFSIKEFYLYFPFADRSFRSTPNAFDGGDGLIPTYVPKNTRTVYFSAPDSGGARNIYMSEDRDSCWSAPVLLGESLVTMGNEISPVLSPDGKTLYFASDALYGMGGYDLYKCLWDDATLSWGEPVNLGFPFSSPADDYMIMESEDGKYILFASNRECPGSDNVYIYVIQNDASPVTKSVTNPDELLALSLLEPSADQESRIDNAVIGSWNGEQNSGTLYMEVFSKTEELRGTIDQLNDDIAKLESRLAAEQDDLIRESIAKAIETKRQEKQTAEKALVDLSNEFGNLEDLLSNASSLNTSIVSDQADTEIVGAGEAYVFRKNRMGTALKVKILPWKQNPRSQFKITPVGYFGPDGSLPQEGFYYQILFLESKRRIYSEDLGGLNPVYERQTKRLQYQYCAGVFCCYQDALHALNEVRRRGFADAVIVAYRGASPISVEEALALEAALPPED